MGAVVRPATLSELDAIVAVHIAGFRAGNAPHLPREAAGRMNAERSAAGWRTVLESPAPDAVALVAESQDDGAVAGVTGAGAARDGDCGPDCGEVYALYVDPRCWGLGLGAALDSAAREHMATHGFTDATLWVLEANERARRFYEREGWQADGERRDHLGAFAVRYRVEL
jgi:GNAT superfamily N-acetyltransferase